MLCGMRIIFFALLFFILNTPHAEAAYHFSNYKGAPPIHVLAGTSKTPQGMTPTEIKNIYHLPQSGGTGTIVIVGAYDDATIEADLATFSKQFNLPACTSANGCFTKHPMSSTIKSNSGWALETSLDIEWAHAIAPKAKILLVEATDTVGRQPPRCGRLCRQGQRRVRDIDELGRG